MELFMITAVSLYNRNNFVTTKSSSCHVVNNCSFIRTVHNDTFFKSKKVSFGSANYNREQAEAFIDDIINKKIFTDKRGFQGEFFRYREKYGIKSPNPMDVNSSFADFCGANNVREFYILNHIKNINPQIAPSPVDLIDRGNKYHLVTNFVEGVHPFNSQINNEQWQNIVKNIFELDINGVYHCDLQSGNILLNKNIATFIDFGAYELLSNKGDYLSSDTLPVNILLNNDAKRLHNSSLEGKFLATFYNNSSKKHLISYSDNPYLNIKSNISNFEYRLIYDYLFKKSNENPKKIFIDYLKYKSKYYNGQMVGFLKSLKITDSDLPQLQQRENAIKTEKLFSKIFSNPSDVILKSELEKIQLKWLINDYQGGKTKAFDFLNKYLSNIEKYSQQVNVEEKQYFSIMQKILEPYRDVLNVPEFNTNVFDEKKCITNLVFDNQVNNKNDEVLNTFKDKIKQVDRVNTNNRFAKIILALLLATAVFFVLHNKFNKK